MNKEQKTLVVYTLEPWDHALTYLRFRAPAEQLGWTVLQGVVDGNVHVDYVYDADIVLMQRVFPVWYDSYKSVVEATRLYQKPLLYEIDDLLIALPAEHPCAGWYLPALEYILMGIIDADRVVVSSELLAQLFSPFNQDIKIWPAYLPDAIWHSKLQTAFSEIVRIGYMGGITHTPDLDAIAPVLQRILNEYGDKVELHFWGCKPSIELQGKVFIHYLEEKINYPEFVNTFSSAEAEIWIAPLRDTVFNRCKSSIKYWEYAAVGGIGVYSDLEPYQSVVENQKDGFLVKDEHEWYRTISNLITNPSVRHATAEIARHKLSEQGKMSLHLDEWRQIYTNVSINDITPERTYFQQAFYRFLEQIHRRTEEKEEIISKLDKEVRFCNQQIEFNEQHLNAILNSRSWRLIQMIGKIRQLIKRR